MHVLAFLFNTILAQELDYINVQFKLLNFFARTCIFIQSYCEFCLIFNVKFLLKLMHMIQKQSDLCIDVQIVSYHIKRKNP